MHQFRVARRYVNGNRISSFLFHSWSPLFVQHKPKEITVRVPWGHISGLHWNESTSAIPIVCLHGWKDNAASFNRIIPALLSSSTNYQFLAIDLPGHGFSSHYPPGMLYQLVDHLIAIRRVISHFGWDEKKGIHFMGHSLGAILLFIFATSHYLMVDCLIAIDALVPVTFNTDTSIGMLNDITDGVLKMESKASSAKTYYEKNQLREKLLTSHMGGLDEIACEELLTRGIVEDVPGSGKWRFAHDPRVQFLPILGLCEEQIEAFAKNFKSKLLHLKAEDGVKYLSDSLDANIQEWLSMGNNHNLKFIQIKDATHHVHLSKPEKIVPHVLQFLQDSHCPN